MKIKLAIETTKATRKLIFTKDFASLSFFGKIKANSNLKVEKTIKKPATDINIAR